MKLHAIKIEPKHFNDHILNNKTFEIRFNDREYKVNEHLSLREWCDNVYTGRSILKKIIFISNYNQKDGFIVMALGPEL
jgi:hypothetical protein